MLHSGLHGPVQVRALGQGKLGSQRPRPRQPQPRPRQCQQIAAGARARGADNWHPPEPSLSPPAPLSTQRDEAGAGGSSAPDFVFCKVPLELNSRDGVGIKWDTLEKCPVGTLDKYWSTHKDAVNSAKCAHMSVHVRDTS